MKPGGSFWFPQLGVTDDAGLERWLLHPAHLPSGTPRMNRVRDRVAAVYHALDDSKRRFTRLALVLAPVGLAVAIVHPWLRRIGITPVLASACFGVFVAVAINVYARFTMRRLRPHSGRVADACLDEGVCPCCGYNLAGVVEAHRAEDGPNIRCSECGASWRRDRVRRVEHEETQDRREAHSIHSVLRNAGAAYASMSIADASGKTVSMIRTIDLAAIARTTPEPRRTRLRTALAALRRQGWLGRVLLSLCVMPLVILGVARLSAKPVEMMGFSDLTYLVMIVLWAVGIVAVLRSDLGRNGAKRAAIMIGFDLCPSCASDLPERDPLAEYRRLCAECGAAWQNPRPEGVASVARP